MSDQGKRPESHAEGLGEASRYERDHGTVEAALRHVGDAHGLDQGKHPLYAAALALGAQIDNPFTSEAALTGLSSELRQLIKALELKTVPKAEVDDVVTSIVGRFKKPGRAV